LGEQLINALRIVDRGWSTPDEMRGSWPRDGTYAVDAEVWLIVGIDYDGDGKISPFGRPTTRSVDREILVNRGKYHAANIGPIRGASGALAAAGHYAAWASAGWVTRDGQRFRKQTRRRRCGFP